jgi:NAD(P)-dependent dehydrogenase (short-subunit alcohol dehydrogenase family)
MKTLNDIFGLEGQTALITGGAGLLGRRHAQALLAAGADVVLADISEKALSAVTQELSPHFPGRVKSVVMDVSSEASVISSHEQLTSGKARIDVLVNNAARNPKVDRTHGLQNSSRLENLNLIAFMEDMQVNLYGAILCAKHFGASMAKQGHGVIVNVASDLGVIAPDQRLYAKEGAHEDQQDVKPLSYSVSKHGLIGLTKYLSTYWAHKGVRANSLSPGGVFAGQNDIFLSRIKNLIPIGRMARDDEYQGALVFLCSPASSYLNGANLVVDGGRSVW